jgi:cation diffusion facilitator CzcD-associated flavoprotein CzcO
VAEPEQVRQELLAGVRAALGPGLEHLVAEHFNPRYRPWQQRIAFVPDGDLFKAVRCGQASVLTDTIETFTETGLQLQSGATLQADVIITATGFQLNALGDIDFSIDGRPLDFADTIAWRGAMFTGVPNLAWVFGYLRASWTLRADLMADFVCRLLKHLDARGAEVVVPALREQDQGMATAPWIEEDNFNSGYLARGVALLPRQGRQAPWVHSQDYTAERIELPLADLEDGSLQYC